MPPLEIAPATALVVIDMQKGIDDPAWAIAGPRNNANAELAALRLIESWRAAKRPIYHVRHDSVEPRSTYRPGQPGHAFKPGFVPLDGEPVVPKQTCSAFVSTPLEAILRDLGSPALVVAGVITNNSVETTVRHAGTLGFAVLLAEDACFTYARRDWRGVLKSADEVHAMSLANLDGEYCRVVRSAEVLAVAGSPSPILPYFESVSQETAWDPMVVLAACRAAELIEWANRRASVRHVGSTAPPGSAGKGIVDLLVTYPAGGLEEAKHGLAALGFQPPLSRDPFPEDRPMRIGTLAHGERLWRIHAHLRAAESSA